MGFNIPLILLLQDYYLLRPGRRAEYCDEHVCLSVCPHIYLRNYTSGFRQIFCAWCLWPWLSPPLEMLEYVMYFRFCGRRSDAAEAALLQCSKQAVWYWLRPRLWWALLVLCARGNLGRVCHTSLPCFNFHLIGIFSRVIQVQLGP